MVGSGIEGVGIVLGINLLPFVLRIALELSMR